MCRLTTSFTNKESGREKVFSPLQTGTKRREVGDYTSDGATGHLRVFSVQDLDYSPLRDGVTMCQVREM